MTYWCQRILEAALSISDEFKDKKTKTVIAKCDNIIMFISQGTVYSDFHILDMFTAVLTGDKKDNVIKLFSHVGILF